MIDLGGTETPIQFTYTADGVLIIPFEFGAMHLIAKFDASRIDILNTSLLNVGYMRWSGDRFGVLFDNTVKIVIESALEHLHLETGYVVSTGDSKSERDVCGTVVHGYTDGVLSNNAEAINAYRRIRQDDPRARVYHVLYNYSTGVIVNATVYPIF